MEEKERFESKYNEKLMKHYAFDNENKEELGYKGVVRVLNQQDKRIKELEQDKTKFMDLLNSMTENWWVSYEKNKKLRQENKQLKQQIAEKDEEIEELNDKLKWKSKWLKTVDNMVGHYEKSNQDKILFAVEQLEKVKDTINKLPITDMTDYGGFKKIYQADATRIIDQQINELKGENE